MDIGFVFWAANREAVKMSYFFINFLLSNILVCLPGQDPGFENLNNWDKNTFWNVSKNGFTISPPDNFGKDREIVGSKGVLKFKKSLPNNFKLKIEWINEVDLPCKKYFSVYYGADDYNYDPSVGSGVCIDLSVFRLSLHKNKPISFIEIKESNWGNRTFTEIQESYLSKPGKSNFSEIVVFNEFLQYKLNGNVVLFVNFKKELNDLEISDRSKLKEVFYTNGYNKFLKSAFSDWIKDDRSVFLSIDAPNYFIQSNKKDAIIKKIEMTKITTKEEGENAIYDSVKKSRILKLNSESKIINNRLYSIIQKPFFERNKIPVFKSVDIISANTFYTNPIITKDREIINNFFGSNFSIKLDHKKQNGESEYFKMPLDNISELYLAKYWSGEPIYIMCFKINDEKIRKMLLSSKIEQIGQYYLCTIGKQKNMQFDDSVVILCFGKGVPKELSTEIENKIAGLLK